MKTKRTDLDASLAEASERVRTVVCRYRESRNASHALAFSSGVGSLGGLFGAVHVPTHGLYLLLSDGVLECKFDADGFRSDQEAIGLDWQQVKKRRESSEAHGAR